LDAPVECTGELWFRRNARITHPMHCGLLRVQRGVKVEFLHPVTTRDARIGGEVRGEITCTGQATFERKSRFVGLVRARKLDLKPGARHEGSTEMLPAEAESML
jgi:cytoskeletal protein CcmA (bactofilin family)